MGNETQYLRSNYMKKLLKPIQVVFSLYGFLVFVAVLLVIFPLVVIASFFGKVKGGNFIYWLCQRWADIIFPLWGMHHNNRFETPHDTRRQYVFVFNHVSFMDIPMIMKTIRGQHFRILAKAELAKVPIFGFVYRQAAVMVNREDAEKRAKSVMQLKSVINKGISVLIAPEGTFNMTGHPLKDFYDGAFRVAIETQTPIKPILFLDGYDRLSPHSIFSLSPGRSRAVFMEEIPVAGLTIKEVPALKAKVYAKMEQRLRYYKASWITDETSAAVSNNKSMPA